MIPFLLAVICSAPANAQELTVKAAQLLRTVEDGRPNHSGDMRPTDGSVFLMIRFEAAKADAPVVLNLLNVQVADIAGASYPVVGIFPSNRDFQVMSIAFRPIGMGAGMSEITDSANSSGKDSDFSLKNYGPGSERKATITLKTFPNGFALFFVVPSKAGAFQIRGLSSKPMTTGNLVLPPVGPK
jgi:hypothetical protein